jgi:hypothetical protein
MVGNSFTPKIFKKGVYSIIIGEGENVKILKNVRSSSKEIIDVVF